MNSLQLLGQRALRLFGRIGNSSLFLLRIFRSLPFVAIRPWLFVQQLFSVGVLTILIIVVAGGFVGMVLGLQGYNILVRYNSEASLGTMVGLTLVRELGPVVTALLFAGRAGSALTAELGLMKTTDQLSAMEMMAVDPFKRIIAPRFLAGFFSMPLLAAIFSAVGILGGYFVGVALLGVDAGAFWSQMQKSVDFYEDFMNGVWKSVVFGFVATWIALFEGYDTVPTSEGIGRATTQSVVHASLAVLGLNFVLTALMLETN
ncbi:MAG TPA: lipid asymmetry maintenance ABC transporter permease subunit MlaE [Gammaproteobacteria bacterium]|nr:lipid asymmetry maintenance ABC transporter permease subunit MlaE [Gammaproteobacteria bacterium]